MKLRLLAPLFTAVSLLVASQSLLAAPTKADARNDALVAALQAVSPDPLGGRLGLAAATAQAAALPSGKGDRNLVLQPSSGSTDQRAYALWKGSNKS